MKVLVGLWKDKSGMGTVEMVIIIAVLVGIALIFKGAIVDFVKNAIDVIFS